MMSSNTFSTLRSRLIEIVQQRVDEARRFKSLEEMTRISGATWRTFWNRTGNPSGEMVEAIAKQWPQYAFWLTTGATDPVAGHVSPPGAVGVLETENDEIPEAVEYFRYQLKLLQETQPTSFDTTGLKEALELLDDRWQEEIAKRMPKGAAKFSETTPATATLLEQLDSLQTPTPEYLAAREELLQEVRKHKRNKLVELRARKASRSEKGN